MIILTKIFIISMFCVGLKKMTEEDMILHGVERWLDKRIKSDLAYKPLIGCVYCYASLWGSLIYWILSIYGYREMFYFQLLCLWPVVCICCVFLNGVLYGILKFFEQFTK